MNFNSLYLMKDMKGKGKHYLSFTLKCDLLFIMEGYDAGFQFISFLLQETTFQNASHIFMHVGVSSM